MATTMEQARSSVKTSSGLDILAGLWLIIAPFLLGYATIAGALWNDIILGTIVVLLAASREFGQGYKIAWPSWTNVVIGLWLIAAPFFLGYSYVVSAAWNDVILGIIIAALALWSALSTPRENDHQK